MVGGGEGAFIGAVHRIAARLDDHYELVAGALSSTPEKALRSGRALGLAPERTYADYAAMAKAEAARADGIEVVAIVTPNDQHAPVAEAFLKAGIHVICDKPVTTTSRDAKRLAALARKHGRIFAVTYNYSGYPMVRQARQMVQEGRLGDIRVVQVEYPQDWLTEPLEATGQKQAGWRTDPARSGAGGCVGDIGTHAYQLAGYVTGLAVEELCAELSTFVAGRRLDDNAQVMLRFHGGARGALWASQVAPGNENNLRIRVYGSKGGLEWKQERSAWKDYTLETTYEREDAERKASFVRDAVASEGPRLVWDLGCNEGVHARIAVVYAGGPIVDGKSGKGLQVVCSCGCVNWNHVEITEATWPCRNCGSASQTRSCCTASATSC